ncbi:MAG: serine--tRNA ligase [Chloroflexi bacterium]|nr:MAG: serine--tRNA ligase [Chloroflexota bacterium]TMG18337.1 MAG: serine--tRNA ligase [Chloroflexota bacterium]
MLSLSFIREHPDLVKDGARKKGEPAPVDEIVRLDAQRRETLTRLEQLKAEQNRRSAAMAKARDQAAIDALRGLKDEVKALEQKLAPIDAHLNALLLEVPNLPDPSVPEGKDSSANPTIRESGLDRKLAFTPRSHYELGERLGLFDFERGVKVATSRFYFLKGAGARLERALMNFMIDLHVREHEYAEVFPPFLLNRAAMTGTGQLPKFEDDAFRIEKKDLFLVPTAEVPVTNMYREEILAASALPIKHVAWSTNFRSEAGAAGKDTRGYIRLHQFNKVELVKFVEPERSSAELELLVKDAEDVLQRLELPYRLILLCTGDMGFGQSKTYDLEAWSPGENRFLEVSSCSNYNDFQARRANIRYRRKDGKVDFVHTLNGSGLALPRTVVAILENYQQEDGTIRVPTALRSYMGGLDVIR